MEMGGEIFEEFSSRAPYYWVPTVIVNSYGKVNSGRLQKCHKTELYLFMIM